ncbi:MAG TPA: shikimate kinase [Coleofasciculaceae cyanobacterium]|jgi:shikimate kinase
MTTDIILIGPMGAGKSTLGKRLAEKLKLPQYSMDDLKCNYYKEVGYDEDIAKQIREKEGFLGIYQYWKPFEIYALERLLSDYKNCVIDLGAGHSVYEDKELFTRAQQALAPYKNVVLLLPSPNLKESTQILKEHNLGRTIDVLNFNEHFIRHHSNYDLAKFTVYTKDKSLESICDEILTSVIL